MNFTYMWSIQHNHSDVLYVHSTFIFVIVLTPISPRFCEIAIPVMAIVIPTFLYGDVVRMVHYIQKKILVTKVEQVRYDNNNCMSQNVVADNRSSRRTGDYEPRVRVAVAYVYHPRFL